MPFCSSARCERVEQLPQAVDLKDVLVREGRDRGAAMRSHIDQTVPPWERVSFRSADDIRRHPRFREAQDCFVDEMIGLYGENHRLIRSLLEYVRAVTFMVVVCLDAVYVADDELTDWTRTIGTWSTATTSAPPIFL